MEYITKIYLRGLGVIVAGLGIFGYIIANLPPQRTAQDQIKEAYSMAYKITRESLFSFVDKKDRVNYDMPRLTWEQVKPHVEKGFASQGIEDRLRASLLSNSFIYFDNIRSLQKRADSFRAVGVR